MTSLHSPETPLSVGGGAPDRQLFLAHSVDEIPELMPTMKVHGEVRVEGEKEFIPWTAEFPEGDLAYEGLVVLIPGFGGVKRSSRAERHANAVAGRPSISYEPARISGSFLKNLTDPQDLHTRTVESVVFAVHDVLSSNRGIPNAQAIDPERLLLSAHSMGGYPATDLSLKHPGMVESVIYKASAGFGALDIRDIEWDKFALEVMEYVLSGKIEPSFKNLVRVLRYYTRSPSRTTGEAITCLTRDMTERVARLGDLGIKSAYMAFENDGLVPPPKSIAHADEVVDMISTFPGFGHLAPQRHAEQVADEAFDLHLQMAA